MANPISKQNKLDKKDIEILKLLKKNPIGLRRNIILKTLNLKNRTLYNHLEKLERLGLILNNYPIWKINGKSDFMPNMAKQFKSNSIQSHKFSFLLKLIKKPDWWEKNDNRFLMLKGFKQNLHKKDWGNSKDLELRFNQFIIGLFPDSIYFINQKEYYNSEPYLALQDALEDTLKALELIEKQVKFKFFLNEIPQFTIKSNHYVKLKDYFAEKCKENHNLIKIEIDGKLRAYVDLSEPFGLETGNKDHAVEDMDNYKIHVEDILKHKPPTNSELANHIMNLAKNQLNYNKNLEEFAVALNRHIPVYEGMKNQVEILTSIMSDLKSEFHDLRKEINKSNIKSDNSINKSILDYR